MEFKKIRIAIATTGRFHVLDLARELSILGEDVTFYSYVPKARAAKFGLSQVRQVSMFSLLAPLVLWQRKFDGIAPHFRQRVMCKAIDQLVAARLAPCDVLICMSGIFLRTAEVARRKYGAKVIVERGSQHIKAQQKILTKLSPRSAPDSFTAARECRSYELADRIAVPSTPVVESFLQEDPSLTPKLMVNPYGVDLDLFRQRTANRPKGPPRLLFVGGWSLRKGADVLTEAIRATPEVQLTHVGPMLDAPFPVGDTQFQTIGSVPQWKLPEIYAGADALVLPSREEGLALVQGQALASGLPLVCTPATGGADLALNAELSDRISVVATDDVDALRAGIKGVVEAASKGWSPLSDSARQALSWAAYAERYQQNLRALV